jgi:predicted metallopeptidase
MSNMKRRSIRYEAAPDIQALFLDIVRTLDLRHVDTDRVACLRSRGSSARRTIARCHGMSKVLQIAMGNKAFYVLEFLSEKFDKLGEKEREETVIHELMHIPLNFGGGFRRHDRVTAKTVAAMHDRYREAKTRKVP